MGRGSRSAAPAVALIAAISLLWVYPFCLFHQASTLTYQNVASHDSNHGSSAPALCDAHVLHAAVAGQETGADTRAGLGLRSFPPSTELRGQFSDVGCSALIGIRLSGFRSASLVSSNKLHSLYAVYQI